MSLFKWFVSVLEGVDETGNALLGAAKGIPQAGNPHYTLSQRWAYGRAAGPAVVGRFNFYKYCLLCKVLTLMFKPFFWSVKTYDHCTDAIKDFPVNLSSEG